MIRRTVKHDICYVQHLRRYVTTGSDAQSDHLNYDHIRFQYSSHTLIPNHDNLWRVGGIDILSHLETCMA